MKNLGFLAIAAVTALVLGAVSFGTKSAQAEVTDTRAVSGTMLLVLGGINPYDGIPETDIQVLADDLGDEDGELEASDLDDIDLDANQLNENNLDTIFIFAFVDDDDMVTFDHDSGVVAAVEWDGVAGGIGDALPETCDAADDNDCENEGDNDGDGVAVAAIDNDTADAGDEIDVEVFQADDTNAVSTEVLTLVGDPDNIAVSAVLDKDTVQTDAGDCDDEADSSDASQIGDVDKTFVVAVVTDNDGTELTGIFVDFASSDDDVAFIGDPDGGTTISVDADAAGIGAFVVVCGGDETGTATIVGEFDYAEEEDDSVEITVVGEPASVALTASPALINCDGVTSSTVTATVTDSEGNNVANGTNVNFSVVALGVASPINAGTVDGVATSDITPLAGGVAGVTVIVTSGDAQSSIRVDCNPAAPATPGVPQPTPTGGTGVTPPDTGNGGYLGQDSSSGFPMWTLVALALGAVAMVGGGLVARRASK